jgi:protein-S-isoprenylcysteine O-methyltransferase Ste14
LKWCARPVVGLAGLAKPRWSPAFDYASIGAQLNPITPPGKKSLIARAFWRGAFGQLIFAALLFGSAGSVKFWHAWAFMGVISVAITCVCIYFYKHDPQLLERRMLRKENMGAQKVLMALWRTLAATSILLAGYDHRVGWSRVSLASVPVWLEFLSLSAILAGHVLFFHVMKANSFAAGVIRVEASQTVITTGPYRLVRHPMYLAFAVMTLFTPLALGSFLALPVAALILLIIILRLLHEELTLRRDLPGYAEYCQRTPHRLIPFIL